MKSAGELPQLVVGIGASWGGLETLQVILPQLLESPSPLSVVIVQHLKHSGEELLIDLLGKSLRLAVELIGESSPLAAGKIYVAPAHMGVELSQGVLRSVPLPRDQRHAPIDFFFASLATAQRERAVGVVLSGGGSDGTLGLKAISDAGGMTMTQSPATAKNPSMPESAAALGMVDYVLPPEEIPVELVRHAEHLQEANASDSEAELTRQIIAAIPSITAVIEKQTENDFKHYKTTTLARRIRRRVKILKTPSLDAYVELLKTSREESFRLFRDLLISVTEFFRDPDAFETLAQDVLPKLFRQRVADQPLRVWVAGCATGEEAYSLAILLREAMDHFPQAVPVQIFATDLDDRALEIARGGSFPIGIQDELAPARLERFFIKRANRYVASKEIRELIVFSSHNLISDPPFTRMDLITCRNLLIYLGSHLQRKLISLFHYAVKPGGFVFLGPSESMSGHKELFRPVDVKSRIYQRKATAIGTPPAAELPQVSLGRGPHEDEPQSEAVDLFQLGQRIVLDEFSAQWVIVDDDGEIYALSSDTAAFLKLGAGAFRNNVISMAHDGLRGGLRTAFAEAKKIRRRVVAENLNISTDRGVQRVDITVQPMPEVGQDVGLHLIAFHKVGEPFVRDVSASTRHSDGGEPGRPLTENKAAAVIEQLERELASTRRDLERTVQELEAANEELKSSNEELLSMNEELQSANEELETSKEDLQASNETLARTNSDLENLLRSTEIATIFLDADNRIRSFTPAATAIYALIDSDVGRPLSDLTSRAIAMPDLPPWQQLEQDLPSPEPLQTSDGRWFMRRMLPYKTRDGASSGMVLTFTDVTELKQTSELLRSSETQLRRIIDNMVAFLGVLEPDGTLVEANRTALEAGGLSREQVLGKKFWDCYWWSHDGAEIQRLKQAIASARRGELVRYDADVRMAGNKLITIDFMLAPVMDEAGIVTHLIPSGVDISDRKTAEQRVSDLLAQAVESSARFQTLADNIAQFAWMAEPDGEIVWYNKRWFDYTGTTFEQMRGWGWTKVHHPEHVDRVVKKVRKAFESGDDQWEDIFPLRRHDGQYRWFLSRMIPIRDKNGQVVRWFGTNTDVTQQKEIEAELEHARQLAEASNQAKSDFLANMSHEIRSPMTAILGFADLLRTDDEEERSKVETIRRNGKFLLELINDILDLSKIEAGKVDLDLLEFSPAHLLEDVCSLMSVRAAESGLELQPVYEGEIPETVKSDPIRLRQVLINLVGNAIKFTDQGTVKLKVRYLPQNKQLRFDVEDTGIGMSPQQLRKLFRPFEQGDSSIVRKYGGSGLGLAISQRLAELLGGYIEARSELGKGSIFSLLIECTEVSELRSVDSMSLAGEGPRKSNGSADSISQRSSRITDSWRLDIRVLVVDDRRDIRFLTQHFVQELGGQVLTASDGSQALELIAAEESAGRWFDIVLMDVQMPNMDGFTAVRTLREQGFQRPIIALTANAMDTDREACFAAGYSDYLSKPIDRQQLLETLRRNCPA